MFNIPKEKYKIYPLYVYILRDLVAYSVVIALMFGVDMLLVKFDNIFLTIVGAIFGVMMGSFMMVSFHEWAHYIGVALGRSKVTMLPIKSLMRLFFYNFKDNSSKQNLTMMISGLVFNFIMFIPLMFCLPDTSAAFIGFKSGVILWMFEIILIELYIGWPRYTGRMNYDQCYKRHTPNRKRNLYISIIAALPFVCAYLFMALR